MADKREYSRLIVKRTNTSGIEPSVPTQSQIEEFIPTDIFEGELFYNVIDKKLWTRSAEEIVLISAGGNDISQVTLTSTNSSTQSILEIPFGPSSSMTVECNIQAVDSTYDNVYNSKLFGTFVNKGGIIKKQSDHGDFLVENTTYATSSTVSSGLTYDNDKGVQVIISGGELEDTGTMSWSGRIEWNIIS
jgi:hypothetical protein